MDPLDVLCVGDAATDVFIRLDDPHVLVREEADGRWIDLPYGGKVPFAYAVTVDAGGNAANAAVALARLGLSTALAAHVGADQVGRTMLDALDREGVHTHLVRMDPGTPSNRNFVLWYGHDRTILVHHQIYDYHWSHLRPQEVPRWLYLSSVGSDAAAYYRQITEWLDAEPTVRFAFQPGTFQIAQSASLRNLYRRVDVLVCNREEAVEIGGGDHGDVGHLLENLHRLGPRIAVVTDGSDGAYASDGVQRYRVPQFPDREPPTDRTGAGDSFAATLVAALAQGHPLGEALTWAPINAMHVVQDVGSQNGLLDRDTLLRDLKDAPEGYAISTW